MSRLALFPDLDCVDCLHDVDGHHDGVCDTPGCGCTRSVFDDEGEPCEDY